MILLDINVLVYAYHRDSHLHDEYSSWLRNSTERFALCEISAIGFVRVCANTSAFSRPATPSETIRFIEYLIDSQRATWLETNFHVVSIFASLVANRDVSARQVPDCWLAAMAIAYDIELATADKGFRHYPELRFFSPV